jgi:hypothetical protein
MDQANGWLALPVIADEKDLADRVLAKLSPFFEIEREVRGEHCSGKRVRLDAILTPHDQDGWLDDSPVLGIEFKVPEATRDVFRHMRQAEDYAHATWPKYGHITIFTCPPFTQSIPEIFMPLTPDGMARWLGQGGVGELGVTREGLTFKVSGHKVWSEGEGVCQRRSLVPKHGSR